jgi:trehalose synthase
LKVVDIPAEHGLEEYETQAHLTPAVRELKSEAAAAARHLEGRTIWMVNSTAQGGGVAEMLPKMIRLLRDLGVRAEWGVMEASRPEFFSLTKRIHNLIHGSGQPGLSGADRQLYDAVSRETADAMRARLAPRDILVIHDPQPMGAGAILKRELGLPTVWRCHIGLDEETPATKDAWSFLRPYAETYDHAVFTAPEYVPGYLARRMSVIHPGIDPIGPKNCELSTNKVMGILCNSGLLKSGHPILTPSWDRRAQRLRPDGRFTAADEGDDVGFGFRPTILQVSRWDRLKGWGPLLKGFAILKGAPSPARDLDRRRIDLARLVLAGPDPSSIQDDPEGSAVLADLIGQYRALAPGLQADVALLALPMGSRRENALMVNVLQRCASLVVQNSLQEGFGLTATEAMWKRSLVLVSRACGLRIQVRDGLEGRVNEEPEHPEAIAAAMGEMLGNRDRSILGARAQRRVYDEFLVFTQLRRWLRVLSGCIERETRVHRRRRP